jgi:geranylgeranyl reductase family protein
LGSYDVIVIGAGPGGSAAAWFLAKSGARVLVIEKKKMPRAKTCGDGLTPRSVKVLEEIGLGPQMSGYQRVRGLRVLGAGRTLELDFPKLSNFCDYGLVRPRINLDSEIVSLAERAGAELWTETEGVSGVFEGGRLAGVRWVRKAKAESGGVTKVDEGEVRAPFVVVADGASSSFGRSLGIRRKESYPLGLAIRTYYQSPRGDSDDFFESWLELRKDGNLLPGYGWIFPVGGGRVNVGVGLLTTFGRWRDVNLNHLQRAFVDILPASYGIAHEGQTEPYKSGRLPMGGSVAKPYGPGFIVIGDAAGLVNPFNGEGIAYALETAKLASGLVADALKSGRTTELAEYREALHDIYGAYFRIGRKFVQLIGHPRAFLALTQVGMRSQTLMEFVFQVLANLGEGSGGRLADRGFRRIVRMAEFELGALEDPLIPAPPVAREKAAAADEAGAA